MEKFNKRILPVIIDLVLFFSLPASVGCVAWFLGIQLDFLILYVIIAAAGTGSILFCLQQERIGGNLDFHNEEHMVRFFIFFIGGLLVTSGCVFLPSYAWPFPVMAVVFSLFSNTLTGIITNTVLLAIATVLAGADINVFFMYFISSCISSLAFRKLDEEFKISYPILISQITLFVISTVTALLSVKGVFNFELLLLPFMNVLITTIVYLIFLKYFSVVVIYRYKENYQVITDQEYCLIIDLKKRYKEEYFHMIHCAYFCDKIANAIGCNRRLAKAGGYYQRIANFCETDTKEAYLQLMKHHHFPPVLRELIMELNQKNKKIIHKEAAIVYFSDAVIEKFMELFKEDAGLEPDYADVLNAVFEEKTQNGIMDHCELTMAQFTRIKSIFMEDRLYYDFLR